MNSKTFFIEKVIEESGVENPRLLELGCGTARYMPSVLEKYPNITYVGLEPYKPSFKKAVENVGDMEQATLYNQLGYGDIEGVKPESFDVVMSVSALEHVKGLGRFIEMSGKYLKPGGLMVHRYDLGHALNPSSLKERLQVFLGNVFPWVLPEDKFVRYVSEGEVEGYFNENQCIPYRYTYHQMPNHKKLARFAHDDPEFLGAIYELSEWEWKHAGLIRRINTKERERLFPSVAIWGKKKS